MTRVAATLVSPLILAMNWLKDHPVLYRGRHVTVVYFGVFAALDCMALLFVAFFYLYLKGIPLDAKTVCLAPLACLLVWSGAKLFHGMALGKKFFQKPAKYLGETGYYVQGGILGAAVWVMIAARTSDLPLVILADGCCWATLLGQFFGRLGCLNYGCCFGKQTSLPIGLRYTNRDSKILRWRPELYRIPVHPTQLYAAGANLIMFLTLCVLLPKGLPDGCVLCFCAAWNGSTRLAIEHFRQDIHFHEGRNWITFGFAMATLAFAAILALAGQHVLPGFMGRTPLVHPCSLRSAGEFLVATPLLYPVLAFSGLLIFLGYGIHGRALGKFPGAGPEPSRPAAQACTADAR